MKTGGEARWTDEFELAEAGSLESAIITDATIVAIPTPRMATIQKNGLILNLHADADSHWDRVETHTYREHRRGAARSVYRLVLVPDKFSATLTLGVTIRIKEVKTYEQSVLSKRS